METNPKEKKKFAFFFFVDGKFRGFLANQKINRVQNKKRTEKIKYTKKCAVKKAVTENGREIKNKKQNKNKTKQLKKVFTRNRSFLGSASDNNGNNGERERQASGL